MDSQSDLDSTNKDKPYYINPEKQRTLNEKLAKISVPHDMDRKPRSLEDIKQWKGLYKKAINIFIEELIEKFKTGNVNQRTIKENSMLRLSSKL